MKKRLVALAALVGSAAALLPAYAYAYGESAGIGDSIELVVTRAGGMSPWIWVGIAAGVVVVIGLLLVYSRQRPKKARRAR